MYTDPCDAAYSELPLGTLDAEKIEAVWCYRPRGRMRQLVLPDGRMDLVVHCSVAMEGCATPSLIAVAGPADTPAVVALRPHTVILGVRFQIGWGGTCLGIAPSALRNRTVAGRDVEQCLGPLAGEILRQHRLQGVEGALRSVAGVLASRAVVAASHRRALRALHRMQHGTQVAAGDVPWAQPSARTVRRDMVTAVGLPLRTLAGVLRFQRAMALVASGAGSLSDVAAAAGYTDQAHMTREFRRFGGFTPGLPTPAPLVRLAQHLD